MKEGEVAVKADHSPTSQRGMRLRWQRREVGRLARMNEKREKEKKRYAITHEPILGDRRA